MEEVREEIALEVNNAIEEIVDYLPDRNKLSDFTDTEQIFLLKYVGAILSIEVTGGVTLEDLIKKGGEREMSEQMVIRLSDTEIRIVKSQCQYCKFWADRLGCNFYPLTPDFADNRPVDSCKVFEKELNHE